MYLSLETSDQGVLFLDNCQYYYFKKEWGKGEDAKQESSVGVERQLTSNRAASLLIMLFTVVVIIEGTIPKRASD